jgi:hypothetical protein
MVTLKAAWAIASDIMGVRNDEEVFIYSPT